MDTTSLMTASSFGKMPTTSARRFGLCGFGVVCAVHASVHSYLVLAYAGSE